MEEITNKLKESIKELENNILIPKHTFENLKEILMKINLQLKNYNYPNLRILSYSDHNYSIEMFFEDILTINVIFTNFLRDFEMRRQNNSEILKDLETFKRKNSDLEMKILETNNNFKKNLFKKDDEIKTLN